MTSLEITKCIEDNTESVLLIKLFIVLDFAVHKYYKIGNKIAID